MDRNIAYAVALLLSSQLTTYVVCSFAVGFANSGPTWSALACQTCLAPIACGLVAGYGLSKDQAVAAGVVSLLIGYGLYIFGAVAIEEIRQGAWPEYDGPELFGGFIVAVVGIVCAGLAAFVSSYLTCRWLIFFQQQRRCQRGGLGFSDETMEAPIGLKCPRCAYDLGGLNSLDHCPECGAYPSPLRLATILCQARADY